MNDDRQIRNLALIGFMATGKSSVGRLAARALGFAFVDTDELIEGRLQKKISEVFAQEGEAWFREYERNIVQEIAHYARVVIATGGGLAVNPANLASLKTHALVVCLWGSPETIWNRARHATHRPLLKDPDPLGKIRLLLAARNHHYRQADILISIERRTMRKVSDQVVHEFRLAAAAGRRPAAASTP